MGKHPCVRDMIWQSSVSISPAQSAGGPGQLHPYPVAVPVTMLLLVELTSLVLLFQVYLWETCLRDLSDQHDCEWRGVLQPGGGAPHS